MTKLVHRLKKFFQQIRVVFWRLRTGPFSKIVSFSGKDRSKIRGDLTLEGLLEEHFVRHSQPDHINRQSISRTLEELNERPAHILETGSSAWGTNSSRLFDCYVRRFGGSFRTIDIRPEAAIALHSDVAPTSQLIVGDSVQGLQWIAEQEPPKFDLVYLDSFDLDANNPIPSMIHGLAEFLWLEDLTKSGTLILIDDTPRNNEQWRRAVGENAQSIMYSSMVGDIASGKGALIAALLDSDKFKILDHGYQLLLRRL